MALSETQEKEGLSVTQGGKGLCMTHEWGLGLTHGWNRGSRWHMGREGALCFTRVGKGHSVTPRRGKDSV